METQAGQFDFKILGQTIKKARTDRKWTREQLAAKLGITSRYLVDIENEGQHPSLQVLYSLVTLFDISIDQFVFPEKEVTQNTQRRQLDKLLDDMNRRDLTIMTGTAKAIQEANEAGE
jgi:transcriptional regulator with XRE-family HTH domain